MSSLYYLRPRADLATDSVATIFDSTADHTRLLSYVCSFHQRVELPGNILELVDRKLEPWYTLALNEFHNKGSARHRLLCQSQVSCISVNAGRLFKFYPYLAHVHELAELETVFIVSATASANVETFSSLDRHDTLTSRYPVPSHRLRDHTDKAGQGA